MKAIIKNTIVYSIATLALASCTKGSSDYISERYSENVGIDFGAPENGGLPGLAIDSEQIIPENMVYIEGGLFVMGQTQQDVMGGILNKPKTVHLTSFYIDDSEVSNNEYYIYLDWLKQVYPPNDPKYKHIYTSAMPDQNVWKTPLGSDSALSKTYLTNIAYADYPVVGVSWRQANDYCKWRSNRVMETVLIQEGILRDRGTSGQNKISFDAEVFEIDPKLLFNEEYSIYTEYITENDEIEFEETDSLAPVDPVEDREIKLNLGKYSPTPKFRLPTEAEWEYAAKADIENKEYNTIRGRKKYAWTGENTIDELDPWSGQRANFKQSNGDYSGIAGWSSDNGDITTPVRSYPPNAYGLYDMSGNVSEWVADVYRPEVATQYNDFNYYRGNIFNKYKIGKDGKHVLTDYSNIEYDTLPNGKIVPKSLPGEIKRIPLDENDVYMNPNFHVADNVDYIDGDKGSLRDYAEEDEYSRKPMYNAPVIPKPAINEETGKKQFVYDDKPRTTLVTNYSRVYKGGSWRDREFWLDPSQRRFLEEYMSTNYIGFRCALTKVGATHEPENKSFNEIPYY